MSRADLLKVRCLGVGRACFSRTLIALILLIMEILLAGKYWVNGGLKGDESLVFIDIVDGDGNLLFSIIQMGVKLEWDSVCIFSNFCEIKSGLSCYLLFV